MGKDGSEKCCASCYSPSGCKAPCAKMGPTPTPAPTPHSPFVADDLVGTWDGGRGRHYKIAINGASINITNLDDLTSCWKTGIGTIDLSAGRIAAVATSGTCTRHASGVVHRIVNDVFVDQDYHYITTSYSILWTTSEGNSWPVWKKTGNVLLPATLESALPSNVDMFEDHQSATAVVI